MIADVYEGNLMSKMMNRFHMWFPGGIVIGSLLSQFMTRNGTELGNTDMGNNDSYPDLCLSLLWSVLASGKSQRSGNDIW